MLLQASAIFLESTPYKDLKKDAPRQNAAQNSVRARHAAPFQWWHLNLQHAIAIFFKRTWGRDLKKDGLPKILTRSIYLHQWEGLGKGSKPPVTEKVR